jgi:RNA polymerase sigma-70 factor (ECF subfamily)
LFEFIASLDQYDPKQGDLQNWLMRLARNLIIDDYRKRQRTPHDNHADDLSDHTYHLRTASSSAQEDIERRELGAQVQSGIDKLSPDLRTCVILRDIEELSYQEIVTLLQIPEGTVKSRINRGRIELAKILRRMKGCGDEPGVNLRWPLLAGDRPPKRRIEGRKRESNALWRF